MYRLICAVSVVSVFDPGRAIDFAEFISIGQDSGYVKSLNASLAFFLHDALSLMDRGFVFTLIHRYCKAVSKSDVMRWDYVRIPL